MPHIYDETITKVLHVELCEISEVTSMKVYIFSFLLLMLVGAFSTGCAANGPGGRWEVAAGVQQEFESGRILPDHTYYYLGSSSAPDSIIAINNQFTLRTRVWAQVNLTQEMFNGWLNWYRTDYVRGCEYHGGVILTPDGRKAGVWYSQNIFNIIRMPEPGVLEVFQPHSFAMATCGAQNDVSGGIGFLR